LIGEIIERKSIGMGFFIIIKDLEKELWGEFGMISIAL
jgi:hypothetical protein